MAPRQPARQPLPTADPEAAPPSGATAQAIAGGTAAALAAAGIALPVLPAAARAPAKRIAEAALEAAVIATLLRFLRAVRSRGARYVIETAREQGAPQQVALDLIGEESHRAGEYERRAQERVRRGLARAYAQQDPTLRQAIVENLLRRERVYAQQRMQAVAVRSHAAAERAVVRVESPAGAYWILDPTVSQHTEDCLIMAGHAHPWSVLDRFHPPTHAGCRCGLRTLLWAVQMGLPRGYVVDAGRSEALLRAALAHVH